MYPSHEVSHFLFLFGSSILTTLSSKWNEDGFLIILLVWAVSNITFNFFFSVNKPMKSIFDLDILSNAQKLNFSFFRSITYLMSKNLNSSTKIKQHMISTLKNHDSYY